MFGFVLPEGLVLFLHPLQFAMRPPGLLSLTFMMVFLSSRLTFFFGASLLLHFIVYHRIFLVHYMARFCTRVKTSNF
jgi:hypothetical protein